MSRESRQRLREQAKRQAIHLARRKKLFQALSIIGIVLIAAGALAVIYFQSQKSKPAIAAQTSTSKTPHSLAELLALSPAELEHCDIARMNLLCAESLPGAEHLNVDEDLAMLDRWAEGIHSEAQRNYHHFREDPAYFYNSENFYRMLMMAVVLYEDFHVRYNPKWMESPETMRLDDGFGSDSSDILIHGLIGPQRLGTCSSMPVLYVALARRLGYPVKLVTTKTHLFLRWDGPTERFNMDATGKGLSEYSDAYYKQWPFPVTEAEMKEDGYLQSLTSAQELSVFLTMRGLCLRQAGRLEEALAAHAAAFKLEPYWRGNQYLLAEAKQALATRQTQAQLEHEAEINQEFEQVMAINRANRARLGISAPPFVPDPTPHIPVPIIPR